MQHKPGAYGRAGPRNGRKGTEGAGKKADSREPKLRECETGLGHDKGASAGANRRNHTPNGVGTSREREGSERALRCARGSRGENRALRANRKREDAKQALEHMSRRALERGRRSGLKEQKESWCGGCFAFLIGLKARERYPFLAKPPLVDKNRR